MKKLNRDQNMVGVLHNKMVINAADDRGNFKNYPLPEDFEARRAYTLKNNLPCVVRAFHGHNHESKLLIPVRGTWKVIVFDMGENNYKEFFLSADAPSQLFIPAGHYNGLVNYTEDNEMLILSSSIIEDSAKDDVRKPFDYLGGDVWRIQNR